MLLKSPACTSLAWVEGEDDSRVGRVLGAPGLGDMLGFAPCLVGASSLCPSFALADWGMLGAAGFQRSSARVSRIPRGAGIAM